MVRPTTATGLWSAPRPFSGTLKVWPEAANTYEPRALYLSCGDSSSTGPGTRAVWTLVLTDPPFFDNVHYSELADFFYAWQQLTPRGFINGNNSTRVNGEVQDADSGRFAVKLRAVFLRVQSSTQGGWASRLHVPPLPRRRMDGPRRRPFLGQASSW